MQEFESRLSGDSDKNLFDPIKREQWRNFENAKLKVSVKVDGKMNTSSSSAATCIIRWKHAEDKQSKAI